MKRVTRCKCFETGEWGMNNEFFLAPDGHYYKDEATYKIRAKRVEYRKKIMDEIADLTGYTQGQVFPTVVTKKLKEMSGYSNEVIYETFLRNEDRIRWSLQNVQFSSEYNKFSYVMSIIANNINDVDRDVRRLEIQAKRMEKKSTDSEIELSSQTKAKPKISHDISKFLGENAWK